MAYTKQTWASGDIITAEKLNHMEDGIDAAQGTGVAVDATLTQVGQAADAAAVGEQLNSLSDEIAKINPRSINNITRTSSDGLIDTYTITYTDGTTNTYTIKNGDADSATIRSIINELLTEHPEWTTTVQDGDITPEKTSFIAYDMETWTEEAPDFTNRLPISIDTNGSIYNGVGYKLQTRVDSSGNEVAVTSGTLATTGLISAKDGDTIRTSGIFTGDSSLEGITFYKSDKTFIKIVKRQNFGSYAWTVDAAGVFNGIIDSAVSSVAAALADTAYIQVIAKGVNENAIITVNQPITYSQVTHNSEPTNFRLSEDIVVPQAEANAARLDALEAGYSGTPDYVIKGAASVADTVRALQGGRTFCFLAISDTHSPYSDATDIGIFHAGQAMEIIRRTIPLDMAAHFGDYVKAGASSTIAESEGGFAHVVDCIADAFDGIPNIRMNGNHDCNVYNHDGTFTADQLFGWIGKYNTHAVTDPDNRARNYGYLDFEGLRLRVIYLNTCDVGDISPLADDANFGGHRCSPQQLAWLINALDLSAKENPEKWQILALGHTPLDWAAYNYTDMNGAVWAMNIQNAMTILDAYNSGASGSVTMEGTAIPYDFAGKNSPVLIGYIHGHTHNYNSAEIGTTGILRLAIPNACNGRENQYAGTSTNSRYGEDVTYAKTAGTVEDTSLNVVTVDLGARKIYCTNYGAGYDREFAY